MLYNVDFALAGLIFMCILFIVVKYQYNKEMQTIQQLNKLLFFLILADFADIVSSVTISYPASVPLWVNYALNVLFFECEIVCISIFPKYVQAVLQKNNAFSLLINKLNDYLVIIFAIICASTPWTHLIFYFDEDTKYTHGHIYLVIFILPLYFLIYSFIRLIYNKNSFNKKQFYSIIGFIVFAIAGPLLQMTLLGTTIVDYFFLSVAAYIIILGLETPDFIKLEKAMEELENHKNLLEIANNREEERNRLIHEMTKSASWRLLMDRSYNVIEAFWSDEFFWLLGYEPEEMVGSETNLWGNSLHPDDAAKTMEAFTKGMQGIEDYDLIYRLRSKDGEYRWYRGTGEVKLTPDHENIIYHGIIQDINEEKIREDLTRERLAAMEELEKSQAALKEAVIKAEAADRAKSDFLANMSHEIRTPINAVLGMNELIQRESSESAIQGYAANVADAGNALLSLINDILDFSKIEAGRMELTLVEYELSDLLREVNNMIRIRCENKGLKFVIKNNPEIPNKLYGDEVRIRQILINFLTNAVKYTDQGNVSLDVNFEKISDEKINLRLSVTDSGIGIKEKDIEVLFDSFKRIDLERNRKKEGTGLGLSITKSFTEMMGGTISVTSEYEKGSTFSVCIPQDVKGEDQIGSFNGLGSNSNKTKYEASFTAPDAHILVVDDVAINLRVLQGLLKQTRIKVSVATSGQECLKKIVDTSFDIILLDHMMPEMDGIETMKRIRQNKEHVNQSTPIIMLTANAIIGAKEEYLNEGFSDYLSKPVRSDELEAVLLKFLPADKIMK